MQNNDRKPEIRFSGFEAGWKKKRFGDEFDILSNNTFSRDFLNYDQGIAKNVHYGDVLVKFNEYLDASKEVLPYIEDEKVIDKFQNSFLRDGDIVIADTAEDETVGKCTEIGQISDLPIIAGLHTMPCRPKAKYAPMYLGYYLNANAYHRELLPLMQGVKVTSISRSGVKDTDIIVSEEYDEQKKIGQFLFTLDEKIKFEQDKLERLIILKKSMLEKMFPQGNSKVPEIRFGEYTDEWELCKLEEVLNEQSNRTFDFIANPLYSLTIEKGITAKTERYERSFLVQKEEELFKIVKPEEFVTNPMNLRFGALGYNDNDYNISVSGYYDVFSIDNNQCSSFWNAYLKTPIALRKFDNAATGSLVEKRRVKYTTLKTLVFAIPVSLDEKQQIGNFFEGLDTLIKFHQYKQDKLRNIKTACTDKMFV
jgi:type I restriction enzyme S subunit